MKDKIEIGEYIRTKKGNIGKVLNITTCTGQKRKKYLIKWNIVKAYYITGITIIKHSPNIIDLIEVGDFINGEPVIEKKDNELFIGIPYIGEDNFYITIKNDKEIKSIVTYQQFKEMEYRV